MQEIEHIINQDLYPGCYIEPKWSKLDTIKLAPYYAFRILLTDQITLNPKGRSDYVSIRFYGTEYIIHIKNYEICLEISKSILKSCLKFSGYPIDRIEVRNLLNSNFDMVLEVIEFATKEAAILVDVQLDKTRLCEVIPDLGACGYYRAILPFKRVAQLDQFYSEVKKQVNFNTIHWFDAIFVHRVPMDQYLAALQNMKSIGKVIVYETDDDIFNIPDYNVNKRKFTKQILDNATAAIDLADFVFASTEDLVGTFSRDNVFHCPNLIDLDDVGETDGPDQIKIDGKLKYFETCSKDGSYRFYDKATDYFYDKLPVEYNPLNILWTGSNTHDRDVGLVTDAIKNIIKTYGMSVRFIFFGYCPLDFVEMSMGLGHEEKKLVVKSQYIGNVMYIEPIRLDDYYETLKSIQPHMAIIPIEDNAFNRSKSNIKWIELSSLEVPCIASDVGPYRCIEHNEDGVLVKNSVNDWQVAIEKMINDPEKRRRIGATARKRIHDEFSWQTDSENRKKWDTAFNAVHELVQRKRIEENHTLESLHYAVHPKQSEA